MANEIQSSCLHFHINFPGFLTALLEQAEREDYDRAGI